MDSLDDLSFSNELQFPILLNYFTNFHLKIIIIWYQNTSTGTLTLYGYSQKYTRVQYYSTRVKVLEYLPNTDCMCVVCVKVQTQSY